MNREVIFLPEVARDFAEGFNYYESRSPGRAGGRFEAAFRKVLRLIEDGLITHGRAFEHFHRVHLPGFPYILYYRLLKNRIVVVAVLYARFDPKRIQGILKQRLD